MSNVKMTRKVKVILATLSVLVLSVVLTACGSSSSQYNEKKPVAQQVNKSISGIEAGAGQMTSTRNALKDYGLDKDGWQLQSSSTAAMLSQMDKAYNKKQPIVFEAWQPHWMFKKYDLKFLKDPKVDFGKAEHIDSVTKKGMKQQNPGAFKLLSQFHWSTAEEAGVMMDIHNGKNPADGAKDFINKNPDLVNKWTKDVPKGNGQTIKLGTIGWDSEVASTNVVAQALDKMGYKANIQTLEPQPLFVGLANGSVDATVSVWLPTTHGQYFNQYKNKLDVAGTTLDGAQTGLAVPKYMTNINSISDLKDK